MFYRQKVDFIPSLVSLARLHDLNSTTTYNVFGQNIVYFRDTNRRIVFPSFFRYSVALKQNNLPEVVKNE